MAETRKIQDLHFMPEGSNFCIVFPPEKEGDLPSAHIIPPEALIDRSVAHGYDPEDEDWEWRVLSHLLHEQHTDAPSHMRASKNYRPGVIESIAEADAVVHWDIPEKHLKLVRDVMGGRHNVRENIERYRSLLPGAAGLATESSTPGQ
jgi:hypothetical protein